MPARSVATDSKPIRCPSAEIEAILLAPLPPASEAFLADASSVTPATRSRRYTSSVVPVSLAGSSLWSVWKTTYRPSPEMSGMLAPPAAGRAPAVVRSAGTVVPATRSRIAMSFAALASTVGRNRFVLSRTASKATTLPSALIEGRSEIPLLCTPALFWLTRVVVPATTSRTTMSCLLSRSFGNRFVAVPVAKATREPSPEMLGSPSTLALACCPWPFALTKTTAPVWRSLRNTSRLVLVPPAPRFVAVVPNTT